MSLTTFRDATNCFPSRRNLGRRAGRNCEAAMHDADSLARRGERKIPAAKGIPEHGKAGCVGVPPVLQVGAPVGIPASFIGWVEEPARRAREAVARVPLRLDEHRAWLEVFREINATLAACSELRRLAGWLQGSPIPAPPGGVWQSSKVRGRRTKGRTKT